MSSTSELLPLPLTPVTAVSAPSGNLTLMFLRLLWRAPTMVRSNARSVASDALLDRRVFGMPIVFLAAEVRAGDAAAFFARLRRACRRRRFGRRGGRRRGRSRTGRRRRRSTSRSCSTMSSVLPRSRSFCSAAIRRALSRGWRPIVGSSSTYSTPQRPLPTWLARRMRWASPPESVGAARPSVR